MDIAGGGWDTQADTPWRNLTLLPLLLMSLARQRHTPRVSNWIHDEYDYIVVGGGAAGSVVAGRLSEDPRLGKILLLEAGQKPPLLTELPGATRYLQGTEIDWEFVTVPQKHASYGYDNKQVKWPMGKMLGGSGNHNGMIYVRGNKKNYDDWAANGAKGWSYRDVLSYFLKLEDDNTSPPRLANGYHAIGGPITLEQPCYVTEIKQALTQAAINLGYQFVDPNAERQTGFYDTQRNTRDNQRCSSVKGYLVPAENNRNLNILLNAMATKVIIDDSRATGVQFYHDGQLRVVKARREVIVSAGTVNSPKLLMLSGIGPREELLQWNISVIADLPVGKNLHDHPKSLYLATLDPRTESHEDQMKNSTNILHYIVSRSGPLAQTNTLSAFLNGQNVRSDIDFPNYALFMDQGPDLNSIGLEPEVYRKFAAPYKDLQAFWCESMSLQPKSRGNLTLSSSNPFDPPLIDPNYLEERSDLQDIVDGLIVCKKLLTSDPVRKLGVRPFETLVPGCEIFQGSNDEYFKCYARHLLSTNFHPVGTCKMGDPRDPTTVVDPELRVKYVKGLRIVDASVMPMIPSANTHIPTLMVAEKASDMIKASLHATEEDI